MTDVGLIPTLGGAAYVDPASFALEAERIFARSWIAVGLAAELPTRGDFITSRLAGEPIVAVRGDDGAIRAFYNVCRHRGSTVCQGPSGSAGTYLRCPYHAWSYDLSGALASAPHLRAMPALDRRLNGLVPVATETWQGLLWCNLDPDPAPLADTVGAQVAHRLQGTDLDRWAMADLALGARSTYEVAANWKLLIENFLECYHCSTIHPELTRTLPSFRSGLGTQTNAEGWAGFAATVDGFSLSGQERFGRLPGLGDGEERRYWGITLHPGTLINLLPDHVVVHRFRPVAVDRTAVTCDWLFAADVVAQPAFDPADTVALFDAVNRQDFEACERCQDNMGSRCFAQGGVLVPAEDKIADFHRWVRATLDPAASATTG